MRSPIRVMCVDDHAFLAEGLRSRLEAARDIDFVCWRPDASDLIDHVRTHRPHIILLDIEMPGPDPFETVEELQRTVPEVRVIIFSAYVRDHYIDQAVARGAWGYLCKSDAPAEVVEAIRRVEKGEFAFSPLVRQRMRRDETPRGDARPQSRLDLLTPRELQVLRLIGKGLSRADIARELFRSPKTIDNHRAAIMEKLDIHDAVELARFAIREGLVEA